MKKHLVLALSLVAGCLSFAQAKGKAVSDTTASLSLGQAIHNVLKNQPGLDEIQANIKAVEADIHEIHDTGYYPKVAANANYTRLDPVSSFNFGGTPMDIMPHNNYNFNVSIDQTIYDFGRTQANINLARSRMLSTQDRTKEVKWTLSYYTAQIYYGILFLQHSINVENEQITTLQHDLELVKKRQEGGTATSYDLLTTKVQIATEQNRKVDLQNQRDKQIIVLRKLMGWYQSRPVALQGTLALPDTTAMLRQPTVNLNNRPDYLLLEDQKNVYQKQYQLARTIELPSLNAGVTGGWKNGYIANLKKLYKNWSFGINLRVPIFSGYASRYQQQVAKAHMEAVSDQQRDLQRTIQSQVATADSDYEAARKKLKTAKLQIQQAQEQIKLARLRYENGVITSQDLLDSETKLAQARLLRLSYIYKMILSRYDLDKAIGKQIW